MGNLRFRLSDMMPNAWFYKLKDMGSGATAGPRTTASHKRNNNKSQRNQPASPPPSNASKPPKQPHHQQYSYSRKSYYFTRDLQSTNDKNTLPNSPSKFSDHPSSPRKSSKQRAAKRRSATVAAARASSPKKLVSSSVSGGCGCRANWNKMDSLASATAGDRSAISLSDSGDSDSFPPEFRSDCSLTTESFDKMVSWSSNSCGCPLELADSGSNDIIIDIDKRSLAQPVHEAFDGFPDRDLPPIFTKPSSFDDRIEDIKRKETSHEAAAKKQGRTSPAKKVENSKTRASSLSVKVTREESLTVKRQQGRKQLNSANSPGIKLRVNSPRIGYRRNIQGQGRKSVSSSTTTTTTNSTNSSSRSSSSKKSLSGCLAVVKSSFDPHTDFRESMVEMIVENNLSASKDLEDLLACYLSLNADEYHDVIIQVFKQIWIDYLTTSRSK